MIRRTHNGAARKSGIKEHSDVFGYLRRENDELKKKLAMALAELALERRKSQKKPREQAA